ncbi:unnamed protein product [Blumeria hordei]|uniref:Uncharacterized protein n=1 Tax=Blumeria hordei TaxID=2867405 RepID=A0A383US70_BLUHO|nr:unnamed protein product [Blumeria hordei]
MGFSRFLVLGKKNQKGSPHTRYHSGQTDVVSLTLRGHLLAMHGRLNP